MNSNQEETTKSDSLPAEVRNLLIEAKSRTYSPYSKFPVGCVLQLDNGEYIQGTFIYLIKSYCQQMQNVSMNILLAHDEYHENMNHRKKFFL